MEQESVEKPAYLVSDIHLGAVPAETEQAFRRWLDHVKESGSRLIINGDLFDFWFDYRRVVIGAHVRVLAALADLVESGIPVTLLGGNHDWWGGGFFEDELGVDFQPEPIRLQLFGKTLHIAHGDGLGAGDLKYRALRLLLRGRLTRWGFRWLHPDFGIRVADRVSKTKERANRPDDRTYARAEFMDAWAQEFLADNEAVDIVALGHTHIPKVLEVHPGRYYVNSGDWVSHRTYVTISPDGAPALHNWELQESQRG